ncbi:hypothetical protein Btru_033803 [Bulinus truncatus]|nr:hypothetical protein Btru_033803 [Bulinus truncatus]
MPGNSFTIRTKEDGPGAALSDLIHGVIVAQAMSSIETSTKMPETHTRHPAETSHISTFDHQVAGQSLILRYDPTTICKCLIHREYMFYQHMPDSLRPFVPTFKGTMDISIREPSHQNGVPQHTCDLVVDSSLVIDPTRYRALQKTTKILADHEGADTIYKFMKLEDLMYPYKRPCILDLKVGVRQHGDDAPQEKIDYQTHKCLITTSHSLGLRLCGVKRYLLSEGIYEKKDKFYGRKLQDDELKNEIINFLHNGVDYRWDLVDSIITQLKQLETEIKNLEGYRFYSCSLVIIYDGEPEEDGSYGTDKAGSQDSNSVHSNSSNMTVQHTNHQHGAIDSVRVRIVDFAHATYEGFETDTVKHIGSDHGFLLGLSTLLEALSEFRKQSL